MFFLPGDVFSSLARILGDRLGESLEGVPDLAGVLEPGLEGVPEALTGVDGAGVLGSSILADADAETEAEAVATADADAVAEAGPDSGSGAGADDGADSPGTSVGWDLVALRSPEPDLPEDPRMEEGEEKLFSEA